jgi:hypothetical protein
VTDPAGVFTHSSAPAGTHARPAQQPNPVEELRDDLAVVAKVLGATSPVALLMLGRRRANRVMHALQAAQREVRRALEATGGRGAGA